MQWIKVNLANESDSRDLLMTTSRNLIFTISVLYLVWHFVATLTWPRQFSPSLWIVTASLGFATIASVYLIERNYTLAHIIWQIGLAAAILLGYALYRRPEITIALVFLPLIAIVTVGRLGTVLVEALVVTSIVLIQQLTLFPLLAPGYAVGIVLGSIFTGFFGWGLTINLLSALSSASYHYNRARELLEETRDHRGEISRILKERNQANYQLERLNQMLEFARNKAEEARDDRDRFILAVSHELRSPLNFILGFSDLMVNSPSTYADLEHWPPGLFEDVKEIYRSSTHLMSLINDILDMGQIDAQQMTIYRERAAISRLVEEVKRMAEPSFRQKELWLEATYDPGLPDVFVDTTRIRQVILNLVTNGLRFTDRGGVTIHVVQQTDSLLVEVEDTGTGIAEGDIPKVFEAFRQVGQDSWRRREGSGLGLAISQRFIELHGGKMWLESDLGKGSRFYFTIPLFEPHQALDAIVEHQARGRRSKPAAADREPLALLLESDVLTSRVIQQSLDSIKIIPVDDPAKLPGMVAELYPQAVFIDKSITPDRKVRLRDLPYDLPVVGIFLPGMANGLKNLPEKVSDYLIKPIKRQDLIQAVKRLGEGISRILVVDDDPAMVRFVTQVLKAADRIEETPVDYEFLNAYTGQEALDHLRHQAVDAILLDLDLPDINGWEVLSELRKNEISAKTPVVIISAVDFPQILYTHGRQVFDIRMRRPFSKGEMTAILNAILNNVKPVFPRVTDPGTPGLQASRAA